jgi:tetratricopeptide (TPR) repeat protein
MKTERRHELQTNVLADWLGHQIEAVRPYTNALLATVLVLVAASLAIAYFVNDRSARNSEGWADYFAAMSERDATRLRTVAALDDDAAWAKKRPVWALWAAQSAGDLELGRGLASLFTSAEEANSALRKAKECFERVAAADYADPDLRQRAVFGLGTYFESIGSLREAAERYDEAIRIKSTSVLAEQARQRKEAVEDTTVVSWYREFDPREAAAKRSPGPGLPADLSNLPELPDLPLGTDSGGAATGETSSSGPADDTTAPPATGDENSANATPSPEQGADDGSAAADDTSTP